MSIERELLGSRPLERFSGMPPMCLGVLLLRSLIGDWSLFDSVLESGRKMSRECFTGMRYVGALLNSFVGLMLVSDSEPSFAWWPFGPREAPREISLVSWLGKLSRAFRKRALLATTVIDLLNVESSALDGKKNCHINSSNWLNKIYYHRCCNISVCAMKIFPWRGQNHCWAGSDRLWHLNHPLGVRMFWIALYNRGSWECERPESEFLSGLVRQFDRPSQKMSRKAKSRTSPSRYLYQWFLLARLNTLVDFAGCSDHLSHH